MGHAIKTYFESPIPRGITVPFAHDGKLESRMDSKLARQQKEAVFRAVRQLTPEQRLNAFLTHCRLVTGLYQAGTVRRGATRRQGS